MKSELKCGLFAGQQAVPLEGVRIEARVAGPAVEVTVTQRYRNREAVPVEAVYVFPLDEAAAVCGFAASVGGTLIAGRVEERDAAFAHYDDAMERGDGAFLLDQERPNVFTASLGNLRPGEAAELQLRYVALAKYEGDALRLSIPTTVAPRYVPAGPPELGQPDGERVNPPHFADVPYGLALHVTLAGGPLRRVESPSHPVRITLGDAGASVELASEDAALDRDFVLFAEAREPRRAEAIVACEADGRRVAMVTFLPDFAAGAQRGAEVLFLLDCSGSMEGTSIAAARRALALCVRALGPEDTFNIVRFGSSFQSLWPAPRAYDDATLDEATAYIAATAADLGGTEILEPLRFLLKGEHDRARPRRVLILTDGQVSNEDQVLSLAREHQQSARIFAFGIGAGASEHLVRGTARASRGAAEMIFPGERIEPKVLRTFERLRAPVFDDARIAWEGLTVEQAPAQLPPVFKGDALTVFARVESGSGGQVRLSFGGEALCIPIDLERAVEGGPIPLLWARAALEELEDQTLRGGSQQPGRPERGTTRNARILALAMRYGLMSSQTSFVAVESRAPSEQTRERAELRRIPVALTTGWGGGQQLAPAVSSGFLSAPVAFAGAAPSPAAPSAGGGLLERAKHAVRSVAKAGSAVFAEPIAPPPPAPSAPSVAAPADKRRARAGAPDAGAPDALYELLMSQRAQGYFERSPVLTARLGAAAATRLEGAIAAHGERVAVTAVVIALLARDHADREAEWRPAANKAELWLRAWHGSFDPLSVL